MKQSHKILVGVVLGIFLVTPVLLKAASPQGYLDAANGSYIAGWAADPDWSGPIYVDIYVDGQLEKTEPANKYREGVGNHAFHWNHSGFGIGSHNVEVKARGVNSSGQEDAERTELINSPMWYVDGARFLAWTPNESSFDNNNGIPLAMMTLSTRQEYRQSLNDSDIFYSLTDAPISRTNASSCLGGWDHRKLIDGNLNTAWSSAYHSGPDATEWFEVWFTLPRDIDYLKLFPRKVGAVSVCVPESVNVYYWKGTPLRGEWIALTGVINLPENLPYPEEGLGKAGKFITFDRVNTRGLRVTTNRLRGDGLGGYYFQLSEVKTGYTTITMNLPRTISFAAAYPGRLYILGDEPNQYSTLGGPPMEYARAYHDFVTAIKNVDPTAKFSPAGFAQPNDHIFGPHFTDYAQLFYADYGTLYGVPPSVDEWRFHAFSAHPQNEWDPDMNSWMNLVNQATDWSVAHGAPMVLGSFGFPGVSGGDVLPQEQLMMEHIFSDKRIAAAVWWSYDWFGDGCYKRLATESYTLTPEGNTYKNFINSH